MTLRILDLFCGAGGVGKGYHRAGFEVMGVDIKLLDCGYGAIQRGQDPAGTRSGVGT